MTIPCDQSPCLHSIRHFNFNKYIILTNSRLEFYAVTHSAQCPLFRHPQQLFISHVVPTHVTVWTTCGRFDWSNMSVGATRQPERSSSCELALEEPSVLFIKWSKGAWCQDQRACRCPAYEQTLHKQAGHGAGILLAVYSWYTRIKQHIINKASHQNQGCAFLQSSMQAWFLFARNGSIKFKSDNLDLYIAFLHRIEPFIRLQFQNYSWLIRV